MKFYRLFPALLLLMMFLSCFYAQNISDKKNKVHNNFVFDKKPVDAGDIFVESDLVYNDSLGYGFD